MATGVGVQGNKQVQVSRIAPSVKDKIKLWRSDDEQARPTSCMSAVHSQLYIYIQVLQDSPNIVYTLIHSILVPTTLSTLLVFSCILY